jgi:hypothetical protein
MKRCAKCGETKPLDDFYTFVRVYSGNEHEYPYSYCRACHNATSVRNKRLQRLGLPRNPMGRPRKVA